MCGQGCVRGKGGVRGEGGGEGVRWVSKGV